MVNLFMPIPYGQLPAQLHGQLPGQLQPSTLTLTSYLLINNYQKHIQPKFIIKHASNIDKCFIFFQSNPIL